MSKLAFRFPKLTHFTVEESQLESIFGDFFCEQLPKRDVRDDEELLNNKPLDLQHLSIDTTQVTSENIE